MCHIRREKGKPSFPILDLYGNERLISLLREQGGKEKGGADPGPFDKSVTCHDAAGLFNPRPAAPYL